MFVFLAGLRISAIYAWQNDLMLKVKSNRSQYDGLIVFTPNSLEDRNVSLLVEKMVE